MSTRHVARLVLLAATLTGCKDKTQPGATDARTDSAPKPCT